MKTFNEWNRLSLSFAEKMTLLQNRIYAVSSAYSGLNSTAIYSVGMGIGVSPTSATPAAPDINDLVSEIDELWAEMKSDINTAKTAKKKTK